MGSPHINLLYYKNILDYCFKRFFSDFNDKFRKDGEIYVLSETPSKNRLTKIFREYIIDEINSRTTAVDLINPEYYFIIGSCYPANNILLKQNFGDTYFPSKLKNIIKDNGTIKYYLREEDIYIDIEMFNSIFENIFDEMFDHRRLMRKFGNRGKNIFFICHRELDCYMLFKSIKMIYGQTLIVNLLKKFDMQNDICIYSINEQIDKYKSGKLAFLKSDAMHDIQTEVKQYMDFCINSIYG